MKRSMISRKEVEAELQRRVQRGQLIVVTGKDGVDRYRVADKEVKKP